MNEAVSTPYPKAYHKIKAETDQSGFSMASDLLTCSLLSTLAASKPNSNFLELGTGTGLSTAWILDGMDAASKLVSIDNDERFLNIARNNLGHDERLSLVLADGEDWVLTNLDQKYDFIFADTWHGKYLLLDEVLNMLNKGGLYIIDDMLPQPNWPPGHAEKAELLLQQLEEKKDLVLTKQIWATGVVIAVKK